MSKIPQEILSVLDDEPLTTPELVDAIGRSKANTYRHLQRLEARGVITRRPDPRLPTRHIIELADEAQVNHGVFTGP